MCALQSHFTLHCFTWMLYFPWDCRKCSEGLCYLMKSYCNIHWYWCVNALYSMMLVACRLIDYFHCFLFSCGNAKNCRLCSVRFICCLAWWKYQLTPVWLSMLFTSKTNNEAAQPAGSFCWNWLTSSHWLSCLRT